MRYLAPFVFLAACATTDASDTDAEPVESIVNTDRAYNWLIGEFDSSEQADVKEDYYSVRMMICPVDMPEMGERVLYLEQAVMTDLDNPYRQRFYVIERHDDDTAISRIFTFANPRAAVGVCDGMGRLPAASTAQEKEGCAVSLVWDGTQFNGGTTTTTCATELGGDYAASEVTLERDRLTSWDRGFFNDGSQAWGVTQGAYEFLRRSEPPAE